MTIVQKMTGMAIGGGLLIPMNMMNSLQGASAGNWYMSFLTWIWWSWCWENTIPQSNFHPRKKSPI